MKEKIKILFYGDAVTPTGFSRVLHSIAENLPQEDYDISWVGVNFFGDPHSYPYRIYPTGFNGDVYGISKLPEIIDREKPDIIFILNDAWVQDGILKAIKEVYEKRKYTLPKIVTYTPVDAADHDSDWYKEFDVVTQAITYTPFGRDVISKAVGGLNPIVIPHGIDTKYFYAIDKPKKEIKKELYPNRPELYEDSFIILSANRNQPRKRLDITMKAFALFADNKPNNVKLYMHCGIRDSHIDIIRLAKRYGIDNKLIISGNVMGVQRVPIEKLNLIYNATDVGVNTSVGEGWSLTQIEHAVTGAPQIVPNHSALGNIYADCGLLVEPRTDVVLDRIMTTGKIVFPEDVATRFEELYQNKDLYNELSVKSITKFTSEEYSWKNVAMQFDKVFKEVL
jgi:glycosyltransferase involved in cell wall biosynthesis